MKFHLESKLVLTGIPLQRARESSQVTRWLQLNQKCSHQSDVLDNCSLIPLISCLGSQEEEPKSKHWFENGSENRHLTGFPLTNHKIDLLFLSGCWIGGAIFSKIV